MRRGLLILLGLLVVTWFEFQVYPGHSYLQGETQLLVPALERLDTPGFLSRDLVASSLAFTYTVYDEITLVLRAAAHLSFEHALRDQQICFRFAAIAGVFLFARAWKAPPLAAVILSGVVNAITRLAAPDAYVTNPEPIPVAFALPLVLLAAGLAVTRMPLLAGLAGGLALLYDPMTAAPFWIVAIAASLADASMRKLLRPAWPALIIFALLLGNLAQLQPGLSGAQNLSAPLTAAMSQLAQIRTPWVWVSQWAPSAIWSYLFLFVAGIWAMSRLRNGVARETLWLALGLSFAGLASLAVGSILLIRPLQFATAMQPARNLALTVAMPVLACGAAAWRAAQQRKWKQCISWAAVVAGCLLNAQILDLLHLQTDLRAGQNKTTSELRDLAAWAESGTWGSSLFEFPGAGRRADPEIFRALSRRSLWAGWNTGVIVDYSGPAGLEWWSRWQANGAADYSPERLQRMLPLPIDYYVLRRPDALQGVKPVFSNPVYVVYDAQDLRNAPGRLTAAKRPD